MNEPQTVSDVRTEELTVTVKALVVGKKTMTQSFFRQLPHRDFPGRKAEGVRVWGHVSYFPDGLCTDEFDMGYNHMMRKNEIRPHVHIVFEQGGQLYRDCYDECDWTDELDQLFIAV